MGKDQFELIFEHVFEEAVDESYQLSTPIPIPDFFIKQSWDAIRKHIEEQDEAN